MQQYYIFTGVSLFKYMYIERTYTNNRSYTIDNQELQNYFFFRPLLLTSGTRTQWKSSWTLSWFVRRLRRMNISTTMKSKIHLVIIQIVLSFPPFLKQIFFLLQNYNNKKCKLFLFRYFISVFMFRNVTFAFVILQVLFIQISVM